MYYNMYMYMYMYMYLLRQDTSSISLICATHQESEDTSKTVDLYMIAVNNHAISGDIDSG